MEIYLLFKAFCFFILVVIGIPGNAYILLKFSYIRIIEKKLMPTNIILMVLALANFFVVLSRAIPQSLNATGLEDLLDDTKCKLVMFTYRVSRAMSICLTSLLSCHQCILIAPTTGLWAYLKKTVTQYVLVIIIAIMCINLMLYPTAILYNHARRNTTTSPYTLRLVYCNADFLTYINYIVNGTLFAIRDFLFVGLMTLASTYIVYVLLRHEKSIKGIRNSDRDQGKSVEYKASRAVILLVVTYALLFSLDNCMWIYTLTLSNVGASINDARIVLACTYPALSPFIIIATNPKLQQRANILHRRRLLTWNYQGDSGNRIPVISVMRN
ncbi:olfactory receptor class A-like protein 1 [Ascaphus truei]|uniref:olfactory receptor class A-like protein 1 n=1 Tax=Ascaphus truei TaxID=8439 RepID=UPI003F596F40